MRASAIASAPAARLTAASRLLTILNFAASPGRAPTSKTLPAMAARTGAQRASATGSPATIIVIVPSAARRGPPETGASTSTPPAVRDARRQRRDVIGIDGRRRSARCRPRRSAAAAPSGPNSTASICAASTTSTIAMSQARASAAGVRVAGRAERRRFRFGFGADVAHVRGKSAAQQAAHDAHAHRAGADDADRMHAIRQLGVLLRRYRLKPVYFATGGIIAYGSQSRSGVITPSAMNCSSVPRPRNSIVPLL